MCKQNVEKTEDTLIFAHGNKHKKYSLVIERGQHNLTFNYNQEVWSKLKAGQYRYMAGCKKKIRVDWIDAKKIRGHTYDLMK